MKKKTDDRLHVAQGIEQFQKAGQEPSQRPGPFKIDAPFEKALDTILQAKPEPKPTKNRCS